MKDALDLEASNELALLDDDGALTYEELARDVEAFSARLEAQGLDPDRGDRVVITPHLSRESVVALLALLSLRAPIVLAHPRWSARERDAVIARTAPRLVLEGARIVATHRPEAHAVRPAVLVFTSGTSGEPKGVCLSRRALLGAAEAHAAALPWKPRDRWLIAMPLAHVGGLGIVLRTVAARRTIVLGGADRFDPDALVATAARHEVTLLSLVPTMLERLLPRRPPTSVRAVLVGGAACPADLLARGRELGWPLLPTYGLSECCAQVCTQRLDDPRPHGVGPPLPGIEVRVRDGVIEVRGATRMDGYLGEPPLAPDAWLRTGDAGLLDEHGHLVVLGRIDDRIVTGGENVDPVAVEEALREHPAIAAACVVGVPDATWGQRVAALIVPRGEPPSVEALRAHLEGRIARFAHPRTVVVVDALPLTPAGKLDRRAARAAFG